MVTLQCLLISARRRIRFIQGCNGLGIPPLLELAIQGERKPSSSEFLDSLASELWEEQVFLKLAGNSYIDFIRQEKEDVIDARYAFAQ